MDEIGDRAGVVSTYFLAAFAMLYVVGSYLPTTDYLTRMDYVIITTTGLLAIMGVENMLAGGRGDPNRLGKPAITGLYAECLYEPTASLAPSLATSDFAFMST